MALKDEKSVYTGEVVTMRSFQNLKLNPSEFSRLLKISRKTIYDWEKEGVLHPEEMVNGNSTRKLFSTQDLLSARLKKPYPISRKKLQVFANVKGGVGKSTLSAQYLMRASMLGVKCLAIDLDPQAHLTYQLGVDTNENTPTIHSVLIEKMPIENAIHKITPTLSLIPSTLTLTLTESRLFQESKREFRIKEALSKIKDQYDIIVADTNPSISILNLSMYISCDEVLIVCSTDFLSFHGLKLMFDQLEDIKADFGVEPVARVIPNFFDVRDGICQESLGAIRKHYGDFITNTVVRKNTDLREASKLRNAIYFVKKNSSGNEDIESLTEDLLQ